MDYAFALPEHKKWTDNVFMPVQLINFTIVHLWDANAILDIKT